MSIQAFNYLFSPTRPLVDASGVPTRDGIDFLVALFNRTGKGTGIIPVVSNPLIATGTTINDALQLTTDWNLIGTVAANTGVKIPPMKPGNDIDVFNIGANTLKVYPPSATAMINALAAGAPFSLAAGKLLTIKCYTLSQFATLGG